MAWLLTPALLAAVACQPSSPPATSTAPHLTGMPTYTLERITFPSHGVGLVGNFCKPGQSGKAPAVVILGPILSVKEQSPIQYATRLAKMGFAALAFDARYHGESGGEPRRLESLKAKEEDVQAALDYLAARPDVDPTRLYLLGVCNGTNEMMQVATRDPRVKALALVSGNYLIKENMVGLLGSEAIWNEHVARAAAAKAKFDATGVVDYAPIVAPSGHEQLLPPLPIWEWYNRWAYAGPVWAFHGKWENRFATMSEAETLSFDALAAAKQVNKPTLVIHGEMSDGGYAFAKQVFAALPTPDKKAVWDDHTVHFQYYEDPVVLDRATAQVVQWFGQHPGPTATPPTPSQP